MHSLTPGIDVQTNKQTNKQTGRQARLTNKQGGKFDKQAKRAKTDMGQNCIEQNLYIFTIAVFFFQRALVIQHFICILSYVFYMMYATICC